MWNSIENKWNSLNDSPEKLKEREENYRELLIWALQYPWLQDFVKFVHNYIWSAEIRKDEKNLNGGYYFNKMLQKEFPNILLEFKKWKRPELRGFLISIFFKVRDSRVINLANYVCKHAEDFKNAINREELKKECPLVAKRNYHLFENKTFLESIKQKFLNDYTSKNKEFYNHIFDQIKDIDSPEDLYEECIETISSIETSDNVIKIYLNEYLLPWVCEQFFIDQKKKSSKQQWLQENKNKITDEEKKEFFDRIINKEEVELISNSSLLTEEQTNIINRIAESFTTLTDKEQKKLKKYLNRLVIKKKPFKTEQFLEKNSIESLPEGTITLLNELWIEVIEKDETEIPEQPETKPLQVNKSNEVDEIIEKDDNIQIVNQQLIELFKQDPVTAIIEKAKSCWYGIENENLLKKQIEAICTSSKYIKNAVLLTLFKDSFTRPILKNSWAYSLEAWWTGCRFVLRQNDNGNFSIVWFYNHDDYEKILDKRKR
jgi:hypothetical protein